MDWQPIRLFSCQSLRIVCSQPNNFQIYWFWFKSTSNRSTLSGKGEFKKKTASFTLMVN
jgi:hypothetical protein